jgi:RNA polymerase sigma-70 factor (ECF subfamily)
MNAIGYQARGDTGLDGQPTPAVPEPVAAASPLSDGEAAHRRATVQAGVVEHLPDLYAFARSLAVNRQAADDLVQSTVLRALTAACQFTPGTNFRAWSFTILRNAFYGQWRSPGARHLALENCLDDTPMTAPNQDAVLEFCDFRRAFLQLAPEHRDALLLIGVSGLDYSAAAAICGCATGTMKSRVSRARSMLRALMAGDNLALSRRDVAPMSAIDIAFLFRSGHCAMNFSSPSASGVP